MANRYAVKIHCIVGENVRIDIFKIPKGGRWTSNHKDGGRALVVIFDRRGRKVRRLQYRQVDRIHWVLR